MLRILYQQAEAPDELQRIANRTSHDVALQQEATVKEIVTAVKESGDQALLDFTEKFDRKRLSVEQLRVSAAELDAAYQQIDQPLLQAIQLASKQIEAFHRQRVPKSWVKFEENDVVLGKRYTPVDRAGLYVPGGRASYPSTVLMNAIPAKVAEVPRIVMVTPMGADLKINPAVLVAAQEAGHGFGC